MAEARYVAADYPHHTVDLVPSEALPETRHFTPTYDENPLLDLLPKADKIDTNFSLAHIDAKRLRTARPTFRLADSYLDFEMLAATARAKAGAKLKRVVRMGGGFEHLRGSLSDDELEAFAVHRMGFHASLYGHGTGQLGWTTHLVRVQQHALLQAERQIHNRYGNSPQAARLLRGLHQLSPQLTNADGTRLGFTSISHDNGEAERGTDMVLERRTDPAEIAAEQEANYELTRRLYVPYGDARLMRLLAKRRAAMYDPTIQLSPLEKKAVSGHVHEEDIEDSMHVVEPSEAFKHATEKVEYLQSGLQAFENVEFDLAVIRSDPELHSNMLRLGISTFQNNLVKLCETAERYVAVYDFMWKMEPAIERYGGLIANDIENGTRLAERLFGMEPFKNYADGKETISADESKLNFWQAYGHWQQWCRKMHVARAIWEGFLGTTHPTTAEHPAGTFLQQTARQTQPGSEQVVVIRPNVDLFGVGLDTASRARHEALAA